MYNIYDYCYCMITLHHHMGQYIKLINKFRAQLLDHDPLLNLENVLLIQRYGAKLDRVCVKLYNKYCYDKFLAYIIEIMQEDAWNLKYQALKYMSIHDTNLVEKRQKL